MAKISTAQVAKKLTEVNRIEAHNKAIDQLDEVEATIVSLGCDVRMGELGTDDRWITRYDRLGYYEIVAEQSYVAYEAESGGTMTEQDEYYGVKDDGYLCLTADGNVKKFLPVTQTERVSVYARATNSRYRKRIVQIEKELANDEDTHTFFDVVFGGKATKPNAFLFGLFDLLCVLINISMLLFYLLSMGRFENATSTPWDLLLLQKIPGLLDFAKANQSLVYICLGVSAVIFALQWLLCNKYIKKYLNDYYDLSFNLFKIQFWAFCLMVAHFLVAFFTSNPNALTDSMLLRGLLQIIAMLVFLVECITRLVAEIALIGGIFVGLYYLVTGKIYRSAKRICGERVTFLKNEQKFAHLLSLYDELMSYTYEIEPLYDGPIMISYFNKNKNNLKLVKRSRTLASKK